MNLKELKQKHYQEIDELRKNCKHKNLKKRFDSSCVGRGSLFPRVDIICLDCGAKKLVFRSLKEFEKGKEIELTLKKQPGFKDQRISFIQYDWELD